MLFDKNKMPAGVYCYHILIRPVRLHELYNCVSMLSTFPVTYPCCKNDLSKNELKR